ncbi:MAG: YbaN family protein [Tidjanibacter sp.]|nr:YbaN family protein [Tidjanibacter sp.]
MRILFILLGSLSLVLAVVGIFLPLLPTTPLLLLAAALYLRSSPRLYEWLLNHKYLGPYIRNFREHRAIPLRAKIVSVALIWITLLYCALWVVSQIWIKILLIGLVVALTIHILSFKTLR